MRILRSLPLAVLLWLGATTVLAAAAGRPQQGIPDPAEAAEVEAPRSEFGHRIAARMETEKAELEALQAELQAKPVPTRAREILAEIRRVKAQTELDLMKIQLEFARREGRAELVAQLEAAIDVVKQRPVFQRSTPAQEGSGR